MAIPVLLAVSIFSFFLMEYTQSDRALLNPDEQYRPNTTKSADQFTSYKEELPLFYFAINPYSFPDTLYKILNKPVRRQAKGFLRQGYSWFDIQSYIQSEQQLFLSPEIKYYIETAFISRTSDVKTIQASMSQFPDSLVMHTKYLAWRQRFDQLKSGRKYAGLYLPTITFHGVNNKFHRWISQLVQGKWGTSSIDNRPAWTKIKEAMSWTLTLNLIAMIVVFAMSIRMGEYLFKHSMKRRSKWLEGVLFFLYSIPRFYLALLLIIFFASDTMHPSLHLFPSPGFIDSIDGASILEKWWIYSGYLWLPLLCMILPSLAYISRLYAAKLQGEQSKPYAFHAWSEGLADDKIIRQHLRKNAILPIFSLIGIEIPALVGGSVVIEVLFNIPGMGRLMMQSIVMQDWTVVFSILLLTGFLTIIGKLATDIFLKQWDSRIAWGKHG